MEENNRGTRAQYPFYCSTPVQLRFIDIDMLGHLNNNSYFQIYDLGRYDYLVKLRGGDGKEAPQPQAVLVNLNCSFIAETHFNERIEVFTQIESIGNKSFTMVKTNRNGFEAFQNYLQHCHYLTGLVVPLKPQFTVLVFI